MKIVFQHATPLPVSGYGGIERILFWHMKELARLGHSVVLIGNSQSKVIEYGIELIVCDDGDPKVWQSLVPADADIIHLSYNYKVPGPVPTIATVHGNGQLGEVFIKNSVFVSRKHAEIHGSDQYVYNALDLSEYPYTPLKTSSEKKWGNFLFLAKASWRVKNLEQTVKACRENKKHLQIIGGKWWGLSRFIHNHGIVGGPKKLVLIKECDALIFPVRWHEPFGIAVIEAMSQGLSVIGSPYGSLPELINSETGFIVNNFSELREKISGNHNQFNPDTIRKYVETNFAINTHAEKYLALYEKVMKGNELNHKEPTLNLGQRAEELLPF
jgi:glycosyltransferase involved in cell wall biosynthesis